MRIIYIHQYFNTPAEGGAIRSYHLAKGLVDAGMEVEMITTHNRKAYDIRNIDGIKIHYLPVTYDNSYGFMRRSKAFLRFVIKAKKLIKKLPRPDLLYITSTPLTTGLIGLWAKKKFGLPYIFEVRDLWPEAPIQMGVIKNRLLQKCLYRLEEKIYRHAHKIVALSPGIKEYIRTKSKTLEIFLIPNISDIHFFHPAKKNLKNIKKLGIKQRFTIAYTGALGRVNALHEFIYLAKEAQNQGKDWQFVLMGKGAKEQKLKRLAEELGLINIDFLPYGNKLKVFEVLQASDVAYISFEHFPVLSTNSPNKFFDALAMGKAILINQKGWIYDLVYQHRLGHYCNPENPAETIRHLEKLAENPKVLQKAQKNSRELALKYFSREKAVKQLLFILDPGRFKLEVRGGAYNLIA